MRPLLIVLYLGALLLLFVSFQLVRPTPRLPRVCAPQGNSIPTDQLLDTFEGNGFNYKVSFRGGRSSVLNFTKVTDHEHVYFYQRKEEEYSFLEPFHPLAVATLIPTTASDADLHAFLDHYQRVHGVQLFLLYYNGYLETRTFPAGFNGTNYFQWPYPWAVNGTLVALPAFEVSISKQFLFGIQHLFVCRLGDFFHHPTLTLSQFAESVVGLARIPVKPAMVFGHGSFRYSEAEVNDCVTVYPARFTSIVGLHSTENCTQNGSAIVLRQYSPSVHHALMSSHNFSFPHVLQF